MEGDEKIRVFLRMRPTTSRISHINQIEEKNLLEVSVPKNISSGYINNSKEKYLFKFDRILNQQTKQEKVFNEIAKDVVDSSLDGYNGTIFAYGQTGSGKTYTITGGAERVEDRGIIPRAISYIFNETKQRSLYKYKVYISYLEIYNNDGYDLLHENHGKAKNLEDLPKVKIRENANKQFLLYNLSVHHVENEEEAMLLLLLGDENRVVAETPKNDASTRSHCIFMFQIESQKIGEDIKTLSKLHIVDLSGSEKPHKTDLNGVRMEEALNINLSLHFLEQVIVSLNKKEGHIPYRNSMMTMCLRDSLGGNCKTRMIATMSCENDDVMESISTCRFAQRVALVQNSAIKNEVEDPTLLIQKQKIEIEELKNELALMKGKDQKSVLDQEDVISCKKIVDDYLQDEDYKSRINLKDMLMINECFSIIKSYYKDLEKKLNTYLQGRDSEVPLNMNNQNLDKVIELENSNKKLSSEIEKLRDLIKRRDEEMKVLINMIDKYKSYDAKKTLLNRLDEEDDGRLSTIKNNFLGGEVNFNSSSNSNNLNQDKSFSSSLLKTNNFEQNSNKNFANDKSLINKSNLNVSASVIPKPQIPLQLLQEINSANSYLIREVQLSKEILSERLKAYDVFRNNYIKAEFKKENLRILHDEKFEQGRKIGERVTKLREKTQTIKNEIVEVRKQKLVENVDDVKDPSNPLKLKEEKLLNDFRDIKTKEKQEQLSLKAIHDEIKSMQAMIDANDKKMTKDFEFWYEIMLKKFEWESKNGKLDQFLSSDKEKENGKNSNQILGQSINIGTSINPSNLSQNLATNQGANKINNFFNSGNSGVSTNGNTLSLNNGPALGNNFNSMSSSISQLADRISKTKDQIINDMGTGSKK